MKACKSEDSGETQEQTEQMLTITEGNEAVSSAVWLRDFITDLVVNTDWWSRKVTEHLYFLIAKQKMVLFL